VLFFLGTNDHVENKTQKELVYKHFLKINKKSYLPLIVFYSNLVKIERRIFILFEIIISQLINFK
jgi:hypothetical protein